MIGALLTTSFPLFQENNKYSNVAFGYITTLLHEKRRLVMFRNFEKCYPNTTGKCSELVVLLHVASTLHPHFFFFLTNYEIVQ